MPYPSSKTHMERIATKHFPDFYSIFNRRDNPISISNVLLWSRAISAVVIQVTRGCGCGRGSGGTRTLASTHQGCPGPVLRTAETLVCPRLAIRTEPLK